MATATSTKLDKAYQDKAEQQQATLPVVVRQTLGALMPHVPALLPPDITTEQFRAALYLEFTGRPDLFECTPESQRDCVIKAASYGLLPGRDAHFLPFRNKRKGGKKDATFVPNYFGLILALERTGKVAKAFAHPVYTGDEFVIDSLADVYKHVPAAALSKPQGTLRFFYGCVRLKDGSTHIEVMDEKQIDEVRRRAPGHDQGPWVDDYLMMARKTALKRVMKYVRLTPEQQQMLEDDQERERSDIPPERHQQNIVDLFGDGQGGYTHTRTGTETKAYQDGPAWDTLRAHRDDARLPEEVLERIAAALSPLAPATESEAHVLAGTVLDWLASAEERAAMEAQ